MNPDFWRGRRVLMTGHTGFKGSWMSLWLQSMGVELTGYALAPASALNMFEIAHVAPGMRSVLGDVRDLNRLHATVKECRPEVIFHMAAQPLVRASYETPVDTYSTNVMGTVHLLEAARQIAGVRAIVNITTDKCYENKEWDWGYRENESLGGYDPYSNSKACSELVSAAYRSSFFNANTYAQHGLAVATVRAGNVIGGGDWAADRIIPDALAALSNGSPVRIRNPHAIRPWQHVFEPLRGYLSVAEKLVQEGPAFGEAWNFGPRDVDAIPVLALIEHLARLWGGGAGWDVAPGEHPHEAHYLKLDISKAAARLNWRPALDVSQALQRTVDWTKRYLEKSDMHAVSIAQIREYQSLSTH